MNEIGPMFGIQGHASIQKIFSETDGIRLIDRVSSRPIPAAPAKANLEAAFSWSGLSIPYRSHRQVLLHPICAARRESYTP